MQKRYGTPVLKLQITAKKDGNISKKSYIKLSVALIDLDYTYYGKHAFSHSAAEL